VTRIKKRKQRFYIHVSNSHVHHLVQLCLPERHELAYFLRTSTHNKRLIVTQTTKLGEQHTALYKDYKQAHNLYSLDNEWLHSFTGSYLERYLPGHSLNLSRHCRHLRHVRNAFSLLDHDAGYHLSSHCLSVCLARRTSVLCIMYKAVLSNYNRLHAFQHATETL